MFVKLHATEQTQSPGQWRHERPKAFRVRFQTALTSASRFLSGGRHVSTEPQGAWSTPRGVATASPGARANHDM